jgi:hypothetical protein
MGIPGDHVKRVETYQAWKEDNRKGEMPLKAPIQSRLVPRGPPVSKTIEEDSEPTGKKTPGSRTHGRWGLFAWPPPKMRPKRDLGKFCFGDRTIPIHARTLGFDVSPHVMGVYYGTVQSAVVHTN